MAKPHDTRQRRLVRQRNRTHDKDYHARERRCRAILTKRTVKNSLPDSTLSCACCRAATHGKDFAVSSRAFAVRLARTAKSTIPVVIHASYRTTSSKYQPPTLASLGFDIRTSKLSISTMTIRPYILTSREKIVALDPKSSHWVQRHRSAS
jgi:hypothetical protein